MKRLLIVAIVLCCAPSCYAQITHDQKISDFSALVGLYDKNYGPYNWKIEAFDYDMLKLHPWLEQVHESTGDLSFYDICVRYVASLHDSHDEFVLPSGYEAFLPFTVDIYDGRVLIDGINRSQLPIATYPFSVGDELVSVDGISVSAWIAALRPYAVNGRGNPVSTNRLAAAIILDRFQGFDTYANKVNPGDTATIQVKSQGKVASYTMTWEAIGVPLDEEGPVRNPRPFPFHAASAPSQTAVTRPLREQAKAASNPWHMWTGAPAPRRAQPLSTSLSPMQRARSMSYLRPSHEVAGSISPFSSPFPVFNPPPGFQLRLGASPTDEFLSGTFPVGNYNVGFIRIPSFAPADEFYALQQFQGEMAYFQQNTSGLVIDVMSNGGGNICYTNNILQYLFPTQFQSIGFAVRATEFWVLAFENELINAERNGADQTTIDTLAGYLHQVEQALAQPRGMTGPLPICSVGLTYPPATDGKGNNLAYSGPIVVLTDNFTFSAAELFGATLQDGKRASVYGVRTNGGGGNVVGFDFNATPYSEGTARVTLSLAIRNHIIDRPGLPPAPYIENIGVNPDVPADYQTRDNLLSGGQTFVNGFSATTLNLIKTGHP
jgi:hypothetical protein